MATWIGRDQVTMFFDPRAEPVAEVAAGERVVAETADSLCGLVKREAPKGFAIGDVLDRLGGACPVTGPIYVRGAKPGGVLEVHVERVTATPPEGTGWTGVFTGFGALTHEAYSLQEPLDPATTLVPYDEAEARLDLGEGRIVRLPVRPFLGTAAVAPARERRMSFSQSPDYLGDVDLPQLRGGAVLVLPVHVPGALLSVGDAHFAQGEGECCGTAIEIAAEVALRVSLRRRGDGGWTPTFPAIEFAEPPAPAARPCFMTMGVPLADDGANADLDLTLAARRALLELIGWLEAERGLSREQAYVLASVAADLRVAEAVNRPNGLVVCRLPLDVFEDAASA